MKLSNKPNFAELDRGSEVYWNDPDDGICSGFYTVLSVNMMAETIWLGNDAGSEVEAYFDECTKR